MGRYPGADWRPSPNFTPGNQGRLAAVVHIAEGGFGGSLSHLTNPASEVSSHFLIGEDGTIAQLVELDDSAWTNGLRWTGGTWRNHRGKIVRPTWKRLTAPVNPNYQTISIELAGWHDKPRPEAQLNALVSLLVWLARQYGWQAYEVGENLIGHRHIDPADKGFCPGPHVNLDGLAASASVALMPPAPPAPVGTSLTADLPIIGGPSVPASLLIAHLDKRAAHLTWQDRSALACAYSALGAITTVGNLLPYAQGWHETGGWTSKRFKEARNPAGLGATNDGAWGSVFPSIEAGVLAQYAHLLSYASGDHPQPLQGLALLSPRREALRAAHGLGVARTWKDLNGRWAVPGPTYAQAIVRIAATIVREAL